MESASRLEVAGLLNQAAMTHQHAFACAEHIQALYGDLPAFGSVRSVNQFGPVPLSCHR